MKFLDKTGAFITRQQWLQLRADDSYRVIRHYLNDRFAVKVEWVGNLADEVPKEHARIFLYSVSNYVNGKLVLDPTEQQTLRTEQEAINLYEAFLVANDTGSEWVGAENRFVERGNKLAPPDKAVPIAELNENGEPENADLGSW